MAQLSSPINSVSMAIHLTVLTVGGTVRFFARAIRGELNTFARVAAGSMAALMLAVGGFGAYRQYWPGVPQYGINRSYQHKANAHLAASNGDMSGMAVSGWVTWSNEDQSVRSFEAHASQMKEVLPFWYRLTKDGHIVLTNGITKQDEVMATAQKYNVRVIPTVTNEFDDERVSSFLDNYDIHEARIQELVATAEAKGYAGWDIDWEHFFGGDRGGFTTFVEALGKALHEHGKVLSVSVPVPTTPAATTDQADAFDYVRLGRAADSLRLMAYDYHEESSSPGPVTPLDQYEATLETVLKSVPAKKLVVGLATYGYDWGKARNDGMQYDQIIARLKDNDAHGRRDKKSQALYAEYTSADGKHTVWYEDAASVQAKVSIARQYGINQISFWRLGGEDPSIWKSVSQ
jgi:spore germination protein